MSKFFIDDNTRKVFCTVGSKLDSSIGTVNLRELRENVVEGAGEKHVPVVQESDGKVLVKVGSVDHPMDESHHIEWIAILTDRGFQIKYLKPNSIPGCVFCIDPSEFVLEAYCFCNLHGLWKAVVE